MNAPFNLRSTAATETRNGLSVARDYLSQHRQEVEDAFWAKVDKTGPCWLWLGGKTSHGYGSIRFGGRKATALLAHRLAYWFTHGEPPPNRSVCHHCDNPSCVRPAHLFLGTHAENMRDRQQKGRAAMKLQPVQVRAIRALADLGWHMKTIGEAFGISGSTAHAIARRKIWDHVQ